MTPFHKLKATIFSRLWVPIAELRKAPWTCSLGKEFLKRNLDSWHILCKQAIHFFWRSAEVRQNFFSLQSGAIYGECLLRTVLGSGRRKWGDTEQNKGKSEQGKSIQTFPPQGWTRSLLRSCQQPEVDAFQLIC